MDQDQSQSPAPAPQQPQPMSGPIPQAAAGGKAIAALVLGILAFPCFCGFLTGIPAIILGHMELTAIEQNRSPRSGEALAKWGYWLGIIFTILACLLTLGYVALIFTGLSPAIFENITRGMPTPTR